eukprot:COSAG02_NODE_615_length_19511_cov_64.132701_19_plen_61_part_00
MVDKCFTIGILYPQGTKLYCFEAMEFHLAEAAERRVEGRRAGGMDDEDLLLRMAGAQGVS